tara:strand:- start:24856 stop:25221 length:366 start_codon:yes stop_codon:yes gene_type:complete
MIKKALVGGVTMLILDGLWLSLFMGKQYTKMIPLIQKNKMELNILGAVLAYILMLYLLIDIVIRYDFSILRSFFFGFAIFGVYDMTCLAVFKNWDIKLAIIDMIWGGFLFAFSKYMSSFVN